MQKQGQYHLQVCYYEACAMETVSFSVMFRRENDTFHGLNYTRSGVKWFLDYVPYISAESVRLN